MQERETKTITTTGDHTITIQGYLTGREANEAKAVLFDGIEVAPGDAPKVPLGRMPKYEQKVLELLIVSFDGVKENAMESFENLPSSEYDDAVAKIKEASGAFLGQTTSTTPGA